MTRNEARKLAFKNAASLIENMDLTQMFGEDEFDEKDEGVLEEAQAEVVKLLEGKA